MILNASLSSPLTTRYCPRNKHGQYNHGASLTELKKRKNAAGNFPSMKKMTWPIPSYPMMCNSFTGAVGMSSSPPLAAPRKSLPDSSPEKLNTMPSHIPYPMTDPLPSCYRPPSPPTILSTQPPCTQLTMYRHQEYIKYYKKQQFLHEKEIKKFEALRYAPATSSPCYVRNFPSRISVTPPGSPQDKFIFPELRACCIGSNVQYEPESFMQREHKVEKSSRKNNVDVLGTMLAELRKGTKEVDV